MSSENFSGNMSSKLEIIPSFKLLKTLLCPVCNLQYYIKDFSLEGSRCPVLLQCGHSMCESCFQQSFKRGIGIECRKCGLISAFDSNKLIIDQISLNVYILGSLVALQIYRHGKDKNLSLWTKTSRNFDYVVLGQSNFNLHSKSGNEFCEECFLEAFWYCENCKSSFCGVCWSKVHSLARSLMKHCKIAICSINNIKKELKKCSHEERILEFFCTKCSVAVCSHCVTLYHQGKEHCSIKLKEKNLQMINKVKAAAQGAELISEKMKQTLEKIINLQSSSRDGVSDLEGEITKNFARIHGILQLEEERLLKKLHENAIRREDSLGDVRRQLETQIERVEFLLHECEFGVSRLHANELTQLYEQVAEVQNMPCYLISENSNQETKVKVSFDERFVNYVQDFCTLSFPSNEVFELRSDGDLPEGYAVEPAALSGSEKSVGFETEQESVGSDDDSSKERSTAPKFLKTSSGFLEKRNYLVRVTFIKDPGEFYVTLNSLRSKQQSVDGAANRFGSRSVVAPENPAKDDIYLVRYNVDKKWYRGRVVEVFVEKPDGEKSVLVYYLDYGNSEIVPVSRLRPIPKNLLEEPPLATKCKLFDSIPKNGTWCMESTKTMAKILNNRTATMFVLKVERDCLEVDLSVIYPESHIGRDIASLRDTLFFLEFSTFINGYKSSACESVSEYPPHWFPSPGETFDVVITHVNSPTDFYIQRAKQDSFYLSKLTIDLQNYYSENSHKGIIYNPKTGLLCAALFPADKKWYRAKIIDVPRPKMVTVLYVDYGNQDTISWTNIRKLNKSFVELPSLAFNCALVGARSSDVLSKNETKSEMENYVLVKYCRVKIHGRCKYEHKLKVFLYKPESGTDICFNRYFTDKKNAAKLQSNVSLVSIPSNDCEKEIQIHTQTAKENTNIEENNEKKTASDLNEKDSEMKEPSAARNNSKSIAMGMREGDEFNEKNNYGKTSSSEDTENELDDCGSIFKLKVEILLAESPSSIYVTFPTLMEEFKNLQSKLNEFYEKCKFAEVKKWAVGDVCAAYDSVKNCWYRASILSLLPNGHISVFLKDVAQISKVPVSALRVLDPSFMKCTTCAIKCHLAGIRPPAEQWPSVTSEHLLSEIENYKEIYMTKKGQIENKSLPVELWIEKVEPRGALEPIKKEWITLNRVLVNQGLAIPKQEEKSVASSSNEEESSFEEKVEVKSEAFISSLSSTWLPAEPLQRSTFIGMPTFVDFDANIYMYDIEQDEEKFKMINQCLLKEYENSEPNAEDHFWRPGQMCIARYHVDNSWYRGLILQTNENMSYEVLFVDYGNSEICYVQDLRKKIKMHEIPILTHKFQLHDILPVTENRKWPISVIETLHSLVVDKKCQVNVLKFPLDFDQACTVSLKVIENDFEVGKILVEQGFAVRKSTTDSPTESPLSDKNSFCSGIIKAWVPVFQL